jgi:UDP-glucose 4-epimerase
MIAKNRVKWKLSSTTNYRISNGNIDVQKEVIVNKDKILIIGKNGFIGSSLAEWLRKNEYVVTSVSGRKEEWRTLDLSEYTTIINCSGIAHRKEKKKNRDLYYRVNRDQAVESALIAKASGVVQYIYISSMNVYGNTGKAVDSNTIVNPDSIYGITKLAGEIELKKLEDTNFKIAIIRPPVVYGYGCKGNVRILVKAAKYLWVFPYYPNKRSMVDIINLCELIRLIIDKKERGIYHPQNKEYISTWKLLHLTATFHKKKLYPIKLFNPIITFLIPKVGFIRKIFGDDCYSKDLSNYENFDYCIRGYNESIKEMVEKDMAAK